MNATSRARSKSSLALFMILAFGIPWIGWITAITTGPSKPFARILFYFGDGCSVAGLIATAYSSGRKGVVDLLKQAINLRVQQLWWMYAIFIPVLWLFF